MPKLLEYAVSDQVTLSVLADGRVITAYPGPERALHPGDEHATLRDHLWWEQHAYVLSWMTPQDKGSFVIREALEDCPWVQPID